MKPIVKLNFIAALSFVAAVSCQVKNLDIENGSHSVHFSLMANAPETKTYLYDTGNGEYQPMWQAGDQLGVYTTLHTRSGSTDAKIDATFTANTSNEGLTASFEGSANVNNSESQTIYSFYPASAIKKEYKGTGIIGLDIKAEQNPVYIDGQYSFDPASDLLIAKPHTCLVIDKEAVSNEHMQFTRISSILKVNLVPANANGQYAGKSVKSITVNAKAHLSGRVGADLSTGEVTAINGIGDAPAYTSYSVKASYTANNPKISTTEANSVFFSVAPVTITSGTTITFTIVTTDNQTIVKEVTPETDVVFPSGQIVVFNLSLQEGITAKTSNPTISFANNTITITAESGANIYYTIDGNTPTTQSTPYSTPISITSDVTVKAIAVKPGYSPSDVISQQCQYTASTGSTWDRVTSLSQLTSGGTFIIGYEATANSGILIPMKNKDYTTSYMVPGSSISMSTLVSSADFEVEIVASSVVDDAICIMIGDQYIGNKNEKNSCKLYDAEADYTAFTPSISKNDVITLTIKANKTYYTLQYNVSSPRFAVYGGTQKNLVIYKKK